MKISTFAVAYGLFLQILFLALAVFAILPHAKAWGVWTLLAVVLLLLLIYTALYFPRCPRCRYPILARKGVPIGFSPPFVLPKSCGRCGLEFSKNRMGARGHFN